MARLAKTAQMALVELDRPCPADEIEGPFMQRVRVALAYLPGSCYEAIARVATALALRNSNNTIPMGYGGSCVRHFGRRSEQLASLLNVSIEGRFSLIEVTSLASIAGEWALGPQRVTQASQKECLRHLAQLPVTPHDHRERWREVVKFLLTSEDSTLQFVRNVACALVWCGYFSPHRSVTDTQLAQQFFRTNRATFVRSRLEALRWLPKLREFSLLLPAGGAQ